MTAPASGEGSLNEDGSVIAKKIHDDELLEEGLEESFPASDPPSVLRWEGQDGLDRGVAPIRPPATFSKEHREFFAVSEDGWQQVAPGIEVKVLAGAFDEARRIGHQNRIARWAPNARLDEVKVHDYFEEVFIASGSLLVTSQANPSIVEAFPAFSFACRPPGAKHGPFQAGPDGCVMFETVFFA